MEKPVRSATQEAYLNLSKLFNLPYDNSMQDWEWEIASYVNFNECLNLYWVTSSEEERAILIEILIQSVANQIDDGLYPEESKNWATVKSLIYANPKLHTKSVSYWKQFHENHEWYPIAKAMQTIWLNIENIV